VLHWSARDDAMSLESPASLQNLRAILEQVLAEAVDSELPIVAARVADALAAMPCDDKSGN
jgi:hypothetical protein